MQELRQGALVFGEGSDKLVIKLPDDANFNEVSALFGKTTDVHTRVGGGGPIASSSDGTCLVSAPNEQGVDGAAILSGTFGDVAVDIKIYSQAKSVASPDSKSMLQTSHVQTIVSKMAKAEKRVSAVWPLGREERNCITLFDVFTNRLEGPKLASSKYKPTENSFVVITTKARMQKTVECVFGVRSRLKRVADADGEAMKKKKMF